MNNGLCDRFCPPLMSDGRFVTDYRPREFVHQLMLKQNGLCSSTDLKLFLQNNAKQLQQINRQFYECQNKSGPCQEYYHPDPNGQLKYWIDYNCTLKNGANGLPRLSP